MKACNFIFLSIILKHDKHNNICEQYKLYLKKLFYSRATNFKQLIVYPFHTTLQGHILTSVPTPYEFVVHAI